MDTRGQYHLRRLVAGDPLAPAIARASQMTPVERPRPTPASPTAPITSPAPAPAPAPDTSDGSPFAFLDRLRGSASELGDSLSHAGDGIRESMEHQVKVRVAIGALGVVSALGLVIILSRTLGS